MICHPFVTANVQAYIEKFHRLHVLEPQIYLSQPHNDVSQPDVHLSQQTCKPYIEDFDTDCMTWRQQAMNIIHCNADAQSCRTQGGNNSRRSCKHEMCKDLMQQS